LEQAGVSSLDAPVSGGDIGAKNGSLAVMDGGPEDAFERVLPILKAMGITITHAGQSGAGQIAKLTNRIMVAAQMVAMGELLILAKKRGQIHKK
jgi:2-hydroxy-3-oxopropionate reductase